MRRPTTWSCSPRRTTSTSGSSGILLRVVVVRSGRFDNTGKDGVGPAVQLGPGDRGRLLLGFLLAVPGARSHHFRADHRLGVKGLLVVGAFLGDAILRHSQRARGGELLKARLPVQPGAQAGRGLCLLYTSDAADD